MPLSRTSLCGAVLLASLLQPPPLHPQVEHAGADDWPLEARLWFDRGLEPVLQVGDRVRVYYRVTRPAHLTLIQIDTEGRLHLLHPRDPGDVQPARGRSDYRLLFPYGNHWIVDEEPGVGYFFAIASEVPFDFSALAPGAAGERWDLSLVGASVRQDPFVAVDELVEVILPEWEEVEYALDFAQYHVGRTYSYPRFLCYDCHLPRPYGAWNPYHFTCSSVRIVIFNDPYFYPATRYRGNRVVYTRPPETGVAQFAFKERARGEPGTPVVQTRGGVVGDAGPQTRETTPPVRAPFSAGDGREREPAVTGAPPGGAPEPWPLLRRARSEADRETVDSPHGEAPAAARPGQEAPTVPLRVRAGTGLERRGEVPSPPRGRPVLEERGPDPRGPGAGVRRPGVPSESPFLPRVLPSRGAPDAQGMADRGRLSPSVPRRSVPAVRPGGSGASGSPASRPAPVRRPPPAGGGGGGY